MYRTNHFINERQDARNELEIYLSRDFPTNSGPNSKVSVDAMYFFETISSASLLLCLCGNTILRKTFHRESTNETRSLIRSFYSSSKIVWI